MNSSRNREKQRPLVLVVDDQSRTLRPLPALMSSDDFSAVWVPDEQQGFNVLNDHPDELTIVIVDIKSSGMGGGGFLQRAREVAPHAAFLITGPLCPFLYYRGKFYEFSGPSLKQEINSILLGIAEEIGPRPRTKTSRYEKPETKERFGVIVGKSRSINEIYRLIENLRRSSATVLIQGESGTGKELIARAIHRNSPRKNRPFVVLNCGAIPGNLMESELFGHERGSFTNAIYQRKGKFEIAHRGTLFLDEIGELDGDLQVKLLRVLQEREFQRVGGNRTLKTDVRIIAATSQHLRQAVEEDRFREDLFYRLNVVPIHVPPLRERESDIPLLLDHFFAKTAGEMGRSPPALTEEARKILLSYTYPGNVRELANIVERLLVTCPDGKITLKDLPLEVREEGDGDASVTGIIRELPEKGAPLREVERELILKTLHKAGGNKVLTARMLGITRRLLYLRLAQYGLKTFP